MNRILINTEVGRKNIVFGILLFLIFGVVIGTPLTIDFFGGSIFTPDGYQAWKVVHAYGVFLSFINFFFGLLIDQMELTRQQKEISSWSILIGGLFGGAARGILLLLAALNELGIYASLGEVVFITVGTVIFVLGQMNRRHFQSVSGPDQHMTLTSDNTLSNLSSDASLK